MIRFFIENKNNEWLCNMEEPGDLWTRDVMKAMAFTYWETANEQLGWLRSELLPGERNGYSVTTHDIREIENLFRPRLEIGNCTIGDTLHFIGIEPRGYDVEWLRGGDGC